MKYRPDYTFAKFDELSPEQQSLVPPLAQRQALKRGDPARLLVRLDDGTTLTPWLEVRQRLNGGHYSGRVGIDPSLEFLAGFDIVFGPDNVIDL